jgi:hypothetical protein
VRDLHARLTGVGRDVWIDCEDIPAAAKWRQDIDDSIAPGIAYRKTC